LVLSNIGLRSVSHGRAVPLRQDLATLPMHIDNYDGHNLPDLPAGEKEVLKADDYLTRVYLGNHSQIGLFIAYYRSQQSGDALHSPKNCLPGSGWEPVKSEVIQIPSGAQPGTSFIANHYVVQKDDMQQDVIYWYQANRRVFASEYWGKIYLVTDAITRNRTDGAIIRLTAYRKDKNDSGNLETLRQFAEQLSSALPQVLPN
jgi:EpsI family protein